MTPDELRRMDNDLCIIFEKGVKPIKARKFYYFESNMARKLAAHALNHNNIDRIDRGVWRKYNPYNPYVEEDKQKQVDNLKVESLDDLFNDTEEEKQQPIQETKKESKMDNLTVEIQEEAPVLPLEDNTTEDQLDIDAKFDELFGPLDE